MIFAKNGWIVLGTILALLTCTPVLATEYSWTIQTIGSGGGATPALAMGRGQTWPTTFYGSGTTFKASSLTPVGWMESNVGPRQEGQAIRARARGDGQVGAITATPIGVSLVQSSKTGWQTASFAANNSVAPDFGYLSSDLPVVAYGENGTSSVKFAAYSGQSWGTETVSIEGTNISANNISLATDSLDRTSLAFSSGTGVGFAMKDPMAGVWQKYTAPAGQTNYLDLLQEVTSISLAVGLNDQTAMLVQKSTGGLTYAWFDIRSGIWRTEVVVASGTMSSFSNLVFDAEGTPAFAYVSDSTGGNLHYRKKVGLGWADVVLPATASTGNYSSASLAFDAENLPVIAFRNGDENMTLAYDPIVVPEPAAGLLLLAGAVILRRRARTN